jgi:hypothetical protein
MNREEYFVLIGRNLSLILIWFIISNKVFSPQYIPWLLITILFLDKEEWIYLAATILLTIAFFSEIGALTRQEPLLVGLVNARNLSLVLLFVRMLYKNIRLGNYTNAILLKEPNEAA